MISNRVHTSEKKICISFFCFFLSLFLNPYFLSFVIQLRTMQQVFYSALSKVLILFCLLFRYCVWILLSPSKIKPIIVFLAINMFYWEIRICYHGNLIWIQMLILYWAFDFHLCIFRVIFCLQKKVVLLTL